MSKQKVFRTGNSLAVTIPHDFVTSIGIKAGQEVQVMTKPETGKILCSFSGCRQLSLYKKNFGKSKK